MGTRESMHPRTAAKGDCPDAVATTFADQSRGFRAFAANRRFPFLSRSNAAAGVVMTHLSGFRFVRDAALYIGSRGASLIRSRRVYRIGSSRTNRPPWAS